MSVQPISKAFFGHEGDEHFNLQAAARTYVRIMKMDDDEARALVSMALFEQLPKDLEYAAEPIAKCVADYTRGRLQALARTLTTRVSKSATTDSALAALALISKAGWEYQEHPRGANADNPGQFSHGWGARGRTKTFGFDYSALPKRPVKGARLSGNTSKLSAREKATYQRAVAQATAELARFKGVPPDQLLVTYHHSNNTRWDTTGHTPSISPEHFEHGGKITHMTVQPGYGAAPSYDVLSALGMGDAALLPSYLHASGSASSMTPGSFAHAWENANAKGTLTDRAFGRIKAGSDALDALGVGDLGGPKTKVALTTAKWVGQHGPEAERVIGNPSRKAAYRYRGVEKAPTAGLQRLVDTTPRDELVHGKWTETVGRGRPGLHRVQRDHTESRLVDYLRAKLPKAELNRLQLATGNTPPSQGVIINSAGKVVTEAVGYGDDWYLPFNLKNLGRLRGGEYFRTRTYGGPTTEDIYAGLVSGARSLTVVSRNGVYNVEFDDHFRGSRRYNDKAARMVNRYAQLLDAVQSNQVSLVDAPPDLLASWNETAERFYPRDRRAQLEFVNAERAKFQRNPTMSPAELAAARQDFLSEVAHERGQDLDQLMTEAGNAMLRRKEAAFDPHANAYLDESGTVRQGSFDHLGAAEEVKAELAKNPDAVMDALGLDSRWDAHRKTLEQAYKAAHSPLVLNGYGYAQALSALAEQFPYYLKKPTYRPLEAGPRDTGYVMPRTLRPTPLRGRPAPEPVGTAPQAQPSPERTTAPREPERQPERQPERVTPEVTAYKRTDAAVKLYHHITDNDRNLQYSTQAGPRKIDWSDQGDRDGLASLGALQHLFTKDGEHHRVMTDAELRAKLGTPGGYADFLSGVEKLQRDLHASGDKVDQGLVDEMKHPGQTSPATKFSPAEYLRMGESAKEHNWATPKATPGAATSDELTGRMEGLALESRLEHKPDESGFSAEVNDTLDKVSHALRTVSEWPNPPANLAAQKANLETRLENLVALKAMDRQRKAAKEAEEKARQGQALAGDLYTTQTTVLDPDVATALGLSGPVQLTQKPDGSYS